MTPQERLDLEKMTLAHWLVGYVQALELKPEKERNPTLIHKLRRAATLLYDGPIYDTKANQQQ